MAKDRRAMGHYKRSRLYIYLGSSIRLMRGKYFVGLVYNFSQIIACYILSKHITDPAFS